VAESIRVGPEGLHASASAVGEHAEELQMRRTAAAGRMEAAQPGMPAGSAAALSAAVAKWRLDTERHVSALSDHSEGFRLSATAYAQTEAGNAERVASLGPRA
jgi:uncharacterized protein YukE